MIFIQNVANRIRGGKLGNSKGEINDRRKSWHESETLHLTKRISIMHIIEWAEHKNYIALLLEL